MYNALLSGVLHCPGHELIPHHFLSLLVYAHEILAFRKKGHSSGLLGICKKSRASYMVKRKLKKIFFSWFQLYEISPANV